MFLKLKQMSSRFRQKLFLRLSMKHFPKRVFILVILYLNNQKLDYCSEKIDLRVLMLIKPTKLLRDNSSNSNEAGLSFLQACAQKIGKRNWNKSANNFQ